jgi:hypothetical protein
VYGTVMIAKPKGSAQEFQAAGDRWSAERGQAAGWVGTDLLAADDGRIVMAVKFESKDAYDRLADDPTQDEWYRTVLAPMLDGDPEWIDGHWIGS